MQYVPNYKCKRKLPQYMIYDLIISLKKFLLKYDWTALFSFSTGHHDTFNLNYETQACATIS